MNHALLPSEPEPEPEPLLLTAQTSIPMADQQQTLAGVIARIRESLDLETIFQTTATEVRQLLRADRVGVFRFYPDLPWEGALVAEDVAAGVSSILAQRIQDHCFSDRFAVHYQQGRINAVSDFEANGFEPCYVELMQSLQVRANIVAPLLLGQELWGLLCIHQCQGPRKWQHTEIEFVRQIADHLSVALRHADLLQQARAQTEQQKALAAVIARIRASLELDTIFQTTATEVRQLLGADRVGVFQFSLDRVWEGALVAEDVAPGWRSLLGETIQDHCFSERFAPLYANGRINAVPDFNSDDFLPCYLELMARLQVQANVVAPLLKGKTLWGLLCIHQCRGPRQWQATEIEFVHQIAEQLSIALQQADFIQQVQRQSAQLAEAIERHRATERHRALAATVDKIRQSLDIATIFQTTTQEVRQLLGVGRVAIYRFNPDWSGEFVADSIEQDWAPLSAPASPLPPPSLPLNLGQPNQVYPRHETFVPILHGDRLWGLLMAYQSTPRYWLEDDLTLLAQVGTQLGVALQQAELLEQMRAQKEELARTLDTLQKSQAHLIQSEKMVGLGQLVAGVAHEINNPINFIAGNLVPAQQYIQDLLYLLSLYQQEHATPSLTLQAAIEDADLPFLVEDLPKTLASMTLGTERICKIVSSLRNFSRLDQADVKPVDIHEGIESTLLILHHRLKGGADHPPIQIIKQYGDLPLVECYPARLNQVFMNLLSNSIDALQEAWRDARPTSGRMLAGDRLPHICITTELLPSQWVRISIADNGKGIPADAQARLFDPFFTTKEPGKGTGLGLSISYQIVRETHGGEIYCQSHPNAGTEFVIEVPIDQSHHPV